MTDLRDELNRMLDQYDERRSAVEARERQVKVDDERFLARFAELRRTIVRPVFESAGAVLTERGHGFSIVEQEFGNDTAGKATEAWITLSIAPLGSEPLLHAGDHRRSLSITTRHYNKTVWINAGASLDSGGMAGAKGAYTLDKIDRKLLEDALLQFVAGMVVA